jgi:hypothetical protein
VVRLGGGGEGEQCRCDGEEGQEAATAAGGGDEHAAGRQRDLSGGSVLSRAVGFGFGPRRRRNSRAQLPACLLRGSRDGVFGRAGCALVRGVDGL